MLVVANVFLAFAVVFLLAVVYTLARRQDEDVDDDEDPLAKFIIDECYRTGRPLSAYRSIVDGNETITLTYGQPFVVRKEDIE